MTEITEVFAKRGEQGEARGLTAGAWLRLPGWRRLVLGMSALGALLILSATYAITTARESERAAAAARADARMLADLLADERARLGPLAATLAATLSGESAAPPGDRPHAAPAPVAQLRAALDRLGGPFAQAEIAVITAGRTTRDGARRSGPPSDLVEDARREGLATALAAGEGARSPPRLWVAWRGATGDGDPPVTAIGLGSAALGHAWSSVPGAIALVDEAGIIRVASERGAAGQSLDGWLSEADAEDYFVAAAPAEGTGLTVHVFHPRRLVSDRVRDVLSIEIMVMSLLATLAFFMDSQLSQRAYSDLSADAEALKSLNARLSEEIAERRRIEKALAQASKLAALGQMSAAVAHELNQPLAAMKTYLAAARRLQDRGDATAAADNLGRVDGLIGRMATLTRDLKAFARKDSPTTRPADLGAAVRHAAEILADRVTAAGARLSLDLGDAPAPVMAEAHRLEQIALNLMQNAIDAVEGAKKPRIDVALSVTPAHLRLSVSDNGPGLPAGEPEQVFAPFFTTKRAGEGLGLGLAISAAIAEDLGGTLAAENQKGGGACFVLSLPPAPAAETG